MKYVQYEKDGELFEKVIFEQSDYEEAIQKKLDAKAKEYGYDNIVSACSYAGYPNPFEKESKRFIKWRSDIWAKCYEILNEVQSGRRHPPGSIQEVLDELPKFEDTEIN